MSIVAKKTGTSFVPHVEGQFAVVCCDVVDLGMVKVEWQGKTKEQHKVWIVFQSDQPSEDGQPMTVRQRFTLSLHEKATLRKFCEAWRGKPYTEEQASEGVDIEAMVGAVALIQVAHAQRNGNVYANISSIMRLPKGMAAPEINPKYVRVKDRPNTNQPVARGPDGFSGYSDADVPDDDPDGLPF